MGRERKKERERGESELCGDSSNKDPNPMESSENDFTQLCPTLCNPIDYGPPGTFVHGFSRQEYWSGYPFPSPRDLPDSGIKPRSLALQEDSLPAEPQRKAKNSGVGSLSLLQ